MTIVNPNIATEGRFARWRRVWFGNRTAIQKELKRLEHENAGMVTLAHFASTWMVILFSLTSLIAFGGTTFTTVYNEWQRGVIDYPRIALLVVIPLIVICVDIAMLYAARTYSALKARGADSDETRIYTVVVWTGAILEGGSYIFMSITFEVPSGVGLLMAIVLIAFICLRGMVAPFIAMFLAMARRQPPQKRDILHIANMQTGEQLVVRMTDVTGDTTVPLSTVLAMYNASGRSSAADTAQFDQLTNVVRGHINMDNGDTNIVVESDNPPRLPQPPTPTNPGPKSSRRDRRASGRNIVPMTPVGAQRAVSYERYVGPIAKALASNRHLKVSELSRQFGVPEAVVRDCVKDIVQRNLLSMASQGAVRKQA